MSPVTVQKVHFVADRVPSTARGGGMRNEVAEARNDRGSDLVARQTVDLLSHAKMSVAFNILCAYICARIISLMWTPSIL